MRAHTSTCMGLCVPRARRSPRRSEEDMGYPRTEATDGHGLPCGQWELNPDAAHEQEAHLTAEPSFQHPSIHYHGGKMIASSRVTRNDIYTVNIYCVKIALRVVCLSRLQHPYYPIARQITLLMYPQQTMPAVGYIQNSPCIQNNIH